MGFADRPGSAHNQDVANKKITDALVKGGLVRPQDTAEARQARERDERRAREAAELADKMADTAPRLPWEAAATGKIVEKDSKEPPRRLATCEDCGESFDPDAPARANGRIDQCPACAAESTGPPRKRGQMVWTHKTAPTLEIEGGRTLTPEELAAMRRR